MNLLRRPLLVFGVLLIGPAAALAWLGWRSVEHEDRLRRSEAWNEARQAAERAVATEAQRLEEFRSAENRRPYFHYQAKYMPADIVSVNGPAFVESPLAGGDNPAGDAASAGWFQWSLTNDSISGPEIFGPGAAARTKDLEAGYGAEILKRLRAAPNDPSLQAAPPVAIPLRAVAANEEVGQLLEEAQVAQSTAKNTGYLENFNGRVQQHGGSPAPEPTVGVRYTSLRYFSCSDSPDLPLVCWRLVWIPGKDAKEQRDAPMDRYLLQGFMASVRFPGADRKWALDGANVFLAAGSTPDDTPGGITPNDVVSRSLMGPLPIEEIGTRLGFLIFGDANSPYAQMPLHPKPHPALSVLAVPALSELEAAHAASRMRYLSILGGLAAVVCIGFGVLLRSVRHEVAVARRKEDFVAAVTHELKTPLASIRMYADMLKEGWVPDGETSSDYAQRIVDETMRLGGLVDQVLDLAAFDRGVASFHPVPGDLGEAVRQSVALLEPASAEAGVPVRVEIEEGLPLVPFDPALLRPIVLNLVDNAIKYSARSEAKDVRVSVRRDGAHLALTVSDRGVGIAANDRGRLFEPFSRGGREETRTARGVGLGLALVKRYADAHGAKISLESEEGKGTTVTVRFPA